MSDARVVMVRDPASALRDRPDGHRLVAPSRWARSHGASSAPLDGLARATVEGQGWSVASRLASWRSLGRAVAAEVGDRDVAAWRRALAAPVATLLAAGVGSPFGSAPTLPDDLSAASRRAWRVAERHAAQLADSRRIDAPAVLAAAAGVARSDDALPWFVVDPAGLTPAQTRFVVAAAPPGSVVVVPPEASDTRGRLEGTGFAQAGPLRTEPDVADEEVDAGGPADEPVAYRFGTRDDEARWILAQVASALDAGVPPGDLLVVVADPASEAPRLEAIAWELSVPIRVRRPMPLSATAVGGFLAQAADAIDRSLPYEATLQTLRHRLAGGMAREAFDAARARRPVGAAAWRTVDPRTVLLDWPDAASPDAYLGRLTQLLDELCLPRASLPPHEAAAVELVVRAFADDPAGVAGVDRRAFLTDLRDLLGLLDVAAPALVVDGARGAAGPVDVVAPTDAAERRVARAYVLGMNEGVLPSDLRDAAVLDFRDRHVLRDAGVDVPGADEQARVQWSVFTAARRAARTRVVFGVPARLGGGAALPSPYLARLAVRPVPAPPRRPASPEERRRLTLLEGGGSTAAGRMEDHDPSERPGSGSADPVLAHARHALNVERRRESAAAPDRFDGVTGRSLDPATLRFSATSLQAIGQCGFRFFARYRLGLRTFEESDERITPVLRGRLWHGALERAVRRALEAEARHDVRPDERSETRPEDHPRDPSDARGDDPTLESADGGSADARLRDRIAREVAGAYHDAELALAVPDPNGEAWQRVRAGEIRALERFVRAPAFLAPGYRPAAVERAFSGTWRGLSVTGVVDRVDVGPDGVELVDYKSGTRAPRGALGDDRRTWTDVQLPLYLETAAPDLSEELGAARAGARARYVSVRSAETLGSVDAGADAPALDALVGRVHRLAATGSWPVDPDARREACATCDLDVVCRVGPRVERKLAARAEEAS